MQDRVPLYPGRVRLTPVAGQENTYDMVRADQPSQAGTPLNKDSLLKDATAALFGLGADAVPDDLFAKIRDMFLLEEENISTKAVMASGSYAGDGQASKFINLSFNPKAVLVVQRGFDFDGSGYEYHAGLAVTDFFAGSESSKKLVSIDGQGFTVYHYDDGNSTNIGYRTYNYVAFT